MSSRNLFVFVCALTTLAIFIACDIGTVEWPTEIPDRIDGLDAKWDTSHNGVLLTWYELDNTRGYQVYRYDESVLPNDSVKLIDFFKDTMYIDKGNFIAGHVYYYKVCAYNGAGRGVMDSLTMKTRPITIPPSKVSNLQAKALSSHEIQTKWDKVEGATDYYIYRSSKDSNNMILVDSVGGGDSSYTDKGLETNTVYYYKVKGKNEGGEGSMSNTAWAKTKLAPPEWVLVEILHNEDNTTVGIVKDTVSIRWTRVDDAIGYEVFFGTGYANETFDFPVAVFEQSDKTVDTLEFRDKRFLPDGLTSKVMLFYKVCAVEKFALPNGESITGNYTENIIGDKSDIDYTSAKDLTKYKGKGFARKK
jgi:fibronectin type 3 domain-containing protein/uncharacterized protein YuzB (UPF0349 family)